MKKQLHNKFSVGEVIDILKRYIAGILDQRQSQALLKIGRSRFFDWLKAYREKPNDFSIEYRRTKPTRTIEKKVEDKIIKALEQEKSLIENKENPIRDYNYSFIKETLHRKNGIDVSLTTIINRAKKMNFIRPEKSRSDTIGKS